MLLRVGRRLQDEIGPCVRARVNRPDAVVPIGSAAREHAEREAPTRSELRLLVSRRARVALAGAVPANELALADDAARLGDLVAVEVALRIPGNTGDSDVLQDAPDAAVVWGPGRVREAVPDRGVLSPEEVRVGDEPRGVQERLDDRHVRDVLREHDERDVVAAHFGIRRREIFLLGTKLRPAPAILAFVVA